MLDRSLAGARQFLAAARGAVPTDSTTPCRCCGESQFAVSTFALGPTFCDHDSMLGPVGAPVCEGCAGLLGGKPSSTDPPLRTRTVIATTAGLHFAGRDDFWRLLTTCPTERFVASWATGGKRHHWLHAGISDRDRMCIGSDLGSIHYVPERHAGLISAVTGLLEGRWCGERLVPILGRKAILSGCYPAPAVARFGPARWAELDKIISRYRGQPLLDLLCWCGPVVESAEDDALIDKVDKLASELLYLLAEGSAVRRADGIKFWGELFASRLHRHHQRPLRDCVARLMGDLQCSPMSESTAGALEILAQATEEQSREIESALADRPSYLVALAYAAKRLKVSSREEESA